MDYSDSTTDLAYTYNRLGKIATVTDVTGTRTFNYALSGTLELQSEDLPAFFGSRRLTYPRATSGVIGRPTGLQLGTSSSPSADQAASYGYQADGRLSTITANAAGYSTPGFTYTYVSNSHLLASTVNTTLGYTDVRTYDSAHNWLDDRETKWSTTTKARFAFAQDSLGRITDIAKTGEMFARYGNGTEGLKNYYTYDDRSQVTSEVTKVGTSSTVLTGRNDSAYAWDHLGNRSSVTHNGDTATYTVNERNQYTQRTVPGVFDVAGAAGSGTTVTVNGSSSGVSRHGEYFFKGHALTNTSAPVFSSLTISDGTTSVGLDAFVAKTAEAMTYDDDGNLLSDGRWNYTYDAENRLIKTSTIASVYGVGYPRFEPNYFYDYLGRRVRITRWDHNGSGWSTVRDQKFLYDGWNVIAEFSVNLSNGSLTLVKNVFWGLDLTGSMTAAGGVGVLLMVQESGNSYLPAYDGNGNIHALIKASDGSLAAAYEYDAFGQTLRESGTYAANNPFRFSTKYADLETGLVYYGLRYYSPSLGRFVNRDPIEEEGGLNLYGFVENNAVNDFDWLGLTELTTDFSRIFTDIYGSGYNAGGATLQSPGFYVVGSTNGIGGTFRYNFANGPYSIALTAGTDQSIIDHVGYNPQGYYIYRGFAFPNTIWNFGYTLARQMVDNFYTDLGKVAKLNPPVYHPSTPSTPSGPSVPGTPSTPSTPIDTPVPVNPSTPTINPTDSSPPATSTPGIVNVAGGILDGAARTGGALINSGGLFNPYNFATETISRSADYAIRSGEENLGLNPDDSTFVLSSTLTQIAYAGAISYSTWPRSALNGPTPLQFHHFATNKSSAYTPQMAAIATKFGLELNQPWNYELMPHSGRHPNAYHDFVLSGMRRAAAESGGDVARFLRLYDQYVKQPIRSNPQLFRKSGWQK